MAMVGPATSRRTRSGDSYASQWDRFVAWSQTSGRGGHRLSLCRCSQSARGAHRRSSWPRHPPRGGLVGEDILEAPGPSTLPDPRQKRGGDPPSWFTPGLGRRSRQSGIRWIRRSPPVSAEVLRLQRLIEQQMQQQQQQQTRKPRHRSSSRKDDGLKKGGASKATVVISMGGRGERRMEGYREAHGRGDRG